MAHTEERRMIHGVPVLFPCKPYPSQFSMMEKVIKGIERKQHCLLESPTGSGKSLALLCSALAWQMKEKLKKEEEEANEKSKDVPPCNCQQIKTSSPSATFSTDTGIDKNAGILKDFEDDDFQDKEKDVKSKSSRGHQTIEYEKEPALEEQSGACCSCQCTAENKTSRKIPKIYFGTRTHKQVAQIVRELKKTAYKHVRMTILGSREHTCIHPQVSRMKNKNEGCKELLDGPTCKFNERSKRLMQSHSQVIEYGLEEAWDLEDFIGVCREKKICPYFGTRNLKKDAEIVFCPYNYLIDPCIRDAMEITVKDNVFILDEGHNIEDSARDAASESIGSDLLEKAGKELDELMNNDFKVPACLRLKQMSSGLLQFIRDNENNLDNSDFDQSYKVWSGYDIVARLDKIGIGPKHLSDIMKAFQEIVSTDDDPVRQNQQGVEIKASGSTLQTFEHIFKVLDYLYRQDLKFVQDYRVAVVRSTSYMPGGNADDSWLNSRKKGGRGKMVPVTIFSLNFWCMNPGVAFSDFVTARNVILTSGTLSPMSSFESELGLSFPIKLEANHVIEDKQVWVGAIGRGPKGGSLQAVYKTMESFSFQDELGELVYQVCRNVPNGVLLFLPSYRALDKFRERWKTTSLWCKMAEKKRIICEPRGSDKVDFDKLLRSFYESVNPDNSTNTDDSVDRDSEDEEMQIDSSGQTGALFIAVCRGKVSEGLDFADSNARAVITVGIPYPNFKDVQVKLKREYNDRYHASRGLLSGSEWYEIQAFRALNQALGRCIRHRRDWGALIIVDERFVRNREKYSKGLSKWVRNKLTAYGSFQDCMDSLDSFTDNRTKDMPKLDNNMSFLPSTPATPGPLNTPYKKDNSLSPVTSTPVSSLLPHPNQDIHMGTPIPFKTPYKDSVAMETSPVMQKGMKTGPLQTKKSPLLGNVPNLPVSLPQGENKNPISLKSPPGQESVSLNPVYQQLLAVMNSPHVPKDKPYYITLNEGTPLAQTFLIQPPDKPEASASSASLTSPTQALSVKGNMVSSSAVVSKPSFSEKETTAVLSSANNKGTGLVSLLKSSSSLKPGFKSGLTTASASLSAETSGQPQTKLAAPEKVDSKAEEETSSSNLYKFCNICMESANSSINSDKKTSVTGVKQETTVNSPTLFGDSEETTEKVDNNNLLSLDNASDAASNRKPLFRKKDKSEGGASFSASRLDLGGNGDDNDDFKQNKSRNLSSREDAEIGNDDLLRVRRSRGVKRKSMSRRGSAKKSRGVDFIDNIEEKENQESRTEVNQTNVPSFACKTCGVTLYSNASGYEKRARLPYFMRCLTTQRHTEVFYLAKNLCNRHVQFLVQDINDNSVTLNSVWDPDYKCVIQFLQCITCHRNGAGGVIGSTVALTTPETKEFKTGDTWLLCSSVNLK